MRQNLPDSAFQLRRTVPLHVHPTPQWQEFNRAILNGEVDGSVLDRPDCYDPEIVYFADNLAQYGDHLEFEIYHPLDSEQSRPKSRRVRTARHRPPRRLSGGGKSRHAAMAATGRGQIVYRQHGNQRLEPGSNPGMTVFPYQGNLFTVG